MSSRHRPKARLVNKNCRRGIRSQTEVAAILGISSQAVYEGEQRALRKLAEHPVMQSLAMECGIISYPSEDSNEQRT
jgi:hypothetical protein